MAKARLPPELEHHKVNLLPNGNFQGALSSVCEELLEEFVECKTSTPTGNMKTMPVNVSISSSVATAAYLGTFCLHLVEGG